MSFVYLALFLSFIVLGWSKPLGGPIIPRQDSPLSPEQTVCGDIVVHASNGYNLFYAETVFECLRSVPFNAAVANRFLDYYNSTLQFQSTLAYLKDPPEGYQQPPIDVLEVLDQIKRNVTAGVYPNQYTFEADVQLLVNRMHDSHVTLNAGILKAFSFVSPLGIFSASVDGKKPPGVYIVDEHLLESHPDGWVPEPVIKINGQDVVEYLTHHSESNSDGYLEPHADWNSLMDHPATWMRGDFSIFQSGTLYPGSTLNFTYENGTTVDTYWLSFYNALEDTGPLTTAGDFYNYFVLGLRPASYNPDVPWWPTLPVDDTPAVVSNVTYSYQSACVSGSPASTNWCLASYGAYPNDPVVVQNELGKPGGGIVTGYFLNDINTGVLSIPSFLQHDSSIDDFETTIGTFIVNATEKKISRVIIDLSQNTGGTVLLAISTFKQFFYGMHPYAASRIRSHEAANVLGEAFSEWWKELEANLGPEDSENRVNYEYAAAEEWVALNRINPATGRRFASWAEYYGPLLEHGDAFTLAQQYNLSDQVFDASAFGGWIPYGYGISANDDAEDQVWAPEDIVILTDGLCSSTCALFVELMTHQAGVRTVTVGGRPTTGPMQAASGSRGARVYEARELDDDFRFVADFIKNTTATALLPDRSDSGIWITSAGINVRDQVRDDDPTPLQFKYQAADCRMYYTLKNVFNMTRLWHDVATAAWDDPSLCVEGSTGFPTGRNTTSTQAPPVRTAEAPVVDLSLGEFVGYVANDTGGFQDSGDFPNTEIYNCKTSADCNGSQCLKTAIKCNGILTPVMACLPKCSSIDYSCSGSSDCQYYEITASKLNAMEGRFVYWTRDVSVGLCRPRRATPWLVCPKPQV